MEMQCFFYELGRECFLHIFIKGLLIKLFRPALGPILQGGSFFPGLKGSERPSYVSHLSNPEFKNE